MLCMHNALQSYSLTFVASEGCLQDPLVSGHIILKIISRLEIIIIYCFVARPHTHPLYKDANTSSYFVMVIQLTFWLQFYDVTSH